MLQSESIKNFKSKMFVRANSEYQNVFLASSWNLNQHHIVLASAPCI